MFWNYIRMLGIELDSPLKEELESCLHGVKACLHDNKLAFRHVTELIGRHERSFRHLQGLGRLVFRSTHGSCHDRSGSKSLRDDLCGSTVWGKSTGNSQLRVVDNDLRALLAIVLFELSKGLDDRDNLQSSGS